VSHFTKLKTKLVDVSVLRQALVDLGYQVSRGAVQVRGYADSTRLAELAVKVGPDYGIGFVRDGGTYSIVADWWQVNRDSGIEERTFTQKLTQRYAYLKVLAEAKRHSWTKVQERALEDGTVELALTKY